MACRAAPALCARKQNARAFTLLELLLVLFILALLMAVGAPLLSTLLKCSRVQSAANAALSSLYNARLLALRHRSTVAVYFGDDLSGLNPKPLPGVLPPYGQIETWRVKTQAPATQWSAFGDWNSTQDDMVSSADYGRPYDPDDPAGAPPDWYPFYFKDLPLSPHPLSFPEGTRIVSGIYSTNTSGSIRRFFHADYRKSALGELKRHYALFNRNGNAASTSSGWGNHLGVLVFDSVTGEHLVLQLGRWYSSARPRILLTRLTHLGSTPLAEFRALGNLVDGFPGDS